MHQEQRPWANPKGALELGNPSELHTDQFPDVPSPHILGMTLEEKLVSSLAEETSTEQLSY